MKYIRKFHLVSFTLIFLSVTACLSVPAFFIYKGADKLFVNELGKNAINIAATLAVSIESDVDEFGHLLENGDAFSGKAPAPGSRIIDLFISVKKATGAYQIYIEKKLSETEKAFYYAVSDLTPSPQPGGNILSEKELTVFNGGVSSYSDPHNEGNVGEIITGYAPLVDRQTGRIVGILAVEYSLDYVGSFKNSIFNIIYSCFCIIVILMTLVIHKLVRSRLKYLKNDFLTSACSKRYFEKKLVSVMRLASLEKRPLCVMMLDIDRFKSINDRHGHLIGDKVLQAFSETLLKCAGKHDLCARFGGDEFAVIMPGKNASEAAAAAEKIRRAVSELDMSDGNGRCFHISVSAGIAEYDGGQDLNTLINNADMALYVSKSSGKDKVTIYRSSEVIPDLFDSCPEY